MSNQGEVVHVKHRRNKLQLDSEKEAEQEEEERKQREEQLRIEEERRKRKEQKEKARQEELKKQRQLEEKYDKPQTMLIEDSDSNDAYARVQKKIRKIYPDFKRVNADSQSDQEESESESQDDEDDSSEEESQEVRPKKSKPSKTKPIKKQRRERKEDSEDIRARRADRDREKVKEQEMTLKERLVKAVAVRWWYCLQEWPPAEYPYEAKLKELKYRLVDSFNFRTQENIVDGFFKAAPLDGYPGVYKTKTKLLDLRPKETAPTLNYLRELSEEHLGKLLRVALERQISDLRSKSYLQESEEKLVNSLERELLKYQ